MRAGRSSRPRPSSGVREEVLIRRARADCENIGFDLNGKTVIASTDHGSHALWQQVDLSLSFRGTVIALKAGGGMVWERVCWR